MTPKFKAGTGYREAKVFDTCIGRRKKDEREYRK